MKKNFFKVSLLMAAAAVCFSCEEPEAEGVSFTSKLNQMTRATSTNFEDSDEIGVTAFSDAEMNTGFATNKQYTYANGKFTSTDPIRNDNEVALIYRAVYPYQAGVGETFTFTANADQSAHESYTESDLMTATTEATTATEPELSFYHKMTNVVVNITSADVALANVVVTAEAQNAASVNLRTNAYAGTGSTTTITFGDNGNNSFRAIVAPQTVAAGVDFINIAVNGVDYTLPTKEAMELRSGVQYSFDAEIKDGQVRFTSVINPWGEADTVPDNRGDSTAVVPEMVLVEGGTFNMGSNDSQDYGASPVHSVTLSDFYIGKYEVTQAEYAAVIGTNPSYFSGDSLPVERVSWYDAIEYCNALSVAEGLTPYYTIDKVNQDPNNTSSSDNVKWTVTCNTTSKGYRLPTEAEWEYAAKGGNQSQGYTYSGSNTVGDVAWYHSNSNSRTHAVGTKAGNELDFHDMSGNVWEWCWDWLGAYSSTAKTNPQGPASGEYRVGRGGIWSGDDGYCRTAYRSRIYAGSRFNYLGFRIARSL